MSCYLIKVENGHKVARSITSEEEYKQLRGSNEQKANLRLACVLRKQNPFGGMSLLSPRPEVTQCVFVSLRERGTVDHVCIAYLTGGYSLIVHPLSLKKARSL